MNQVNLIGRLVRDPEIRFVPGSGKAVANFTMAVDKNLARDKKAEFEQKGQPTADFIRIVVWGKSAENCANYLTKGRLVAVSGSIQTSSYKTNTGETRYVTDVQASNVEFLEHGKKQEDSAESDFGDFQPSEGDDDLPWMQP